MVLLQLLAKSSRLPVTSYAVPLNIHRYIWFTLFYGIIQHLKKIIGFVSGATHSTIIQTLEIHYKQGKFRATKQA